MNIVLPKYIVPRPAAEANHKSKLLHAVNSVAEILLTTDVENFEKSLREAMSIVARCLDISRVYIWQNQVKNGKLRYVQQFEWLDNAEPKGKLVSHKDMFTYADSIPEWEEKFLNGQCVNGPLSSLSPTEQERLSPYGIKSILVVPVHLRGNLWGFVSFDDCCRERSFTEDEIGILRSGNLMLASALDRHETNAKIREVDEHAKLMLDAMPICCSLWDSKFNIIDCNAAAVELFELKDKKEYMANFKRLSPKYQPDGGFSTKKAREYVDIVFREGGPFVFEWQHQMLNGEQLPVEVTLVRVRRGEEFIVAGYTRDLREYKKMMASIQAAVEQAQAASMAKSAFLAHMSHEIRTPMNVIAGMTEIILQEDVPRSIYEHVLSIKHASANMLSLISDVLDFSKIEAGSLDIVPAEYSLTSLINNVLIITRLKVREKPVMFTANIDCQLPNWLIGDETRIRQVLLNVLDNAAKYTAEGFISLTVSGETEGDTVILTARISDSGIGIKQADIDNLFDNFMRFDGERNKSVQGTGLGLPISKSLCQAMGGSISVESTYGEGTTFNIRIPQKIKSHEEKFATITEPETKPVLLYEARPVYAQSIMRSFADLGVSCTLAKNQHEFYEALRHTSYAFAFVAATLFASSAWAAKELSPQTAVVLIMEFGESPDMRGFRTISTPVHAASIANILNDVEDSVLYGESGRGLVRFIAPSANVLIVDDLYTNLNVAKGLMLPYQMQIDICESGEKAIEYVQKKRYDIIFMDHMMPDMDGIEAANRIRALGAEDAYFGKVPIIALTANAVSGVKEMFLQNGMDDFLSKPIDITKLHALLGKWLPKEKRVRYINKKSRQQFKHMHAVPIHIEGIDIQAGVVMAGGLTADYLKLLAVFHVDGKDKIDKLQDCLEKNDIKLYTTYAHGLKSAAASIGAKEVSDLFKSLELAGIQDDAAFIIRNNKHAIEELDTLLNNIYTVIAGDEDIPAQENDLQLYQEELAKLKKALINRDAGEIDDIMKKLETVKWNKQTAALFREISRSILLINYTDAALYVDKLLAARHPY